MITHLGHVAFKVSDLDKALDFYCNILGLKEAFRINNDEDQPNLVYIKINGDNFIELFPGGQGESVYDNAKTGYKHVCLLVDDMEATLKQLSDRGLDISGQPNQGKSGCIQYFITDPDGNRIELMQIIPGSMQDKARD